MDWVSELCDLYEKNKYLAGEMRYKEQIRKNGLEKIPLVLLPPFHTTVTAQITVTISESGEFQDAKLVENEDKLTIIPVTENSASRTSTVVPHPLCDNIKYLSGDYKDYCIEGTKNAEECYQLYIEALRRWHFSLYSHKKVDALYLYLSKKCLIWDLVNEGVLKLGENGKLSESVKIQGIEQDKSFVRFRILEEYQGDEDILSDITGQYYSECWLDRTLQERFIQYYRSLMTEKDICYLSGNIEQPTYLHSKKIRNEGDNSKLISSNDKDYYTFRGRFHNKEQAFAIGNETSQKVHNALKWIIRRQGKNIDTFCIVSWESDLCPMPEWDLDTDSICSQYEEDWGEEEEEVQVWDGNQAGAFQFSAALLGYRRKLENMSRMVLMAFDAATTGRLALVEYKNLETSRYLDNIKYWHKECEWLHLKLKEGGSYYYKGMVGVKEIADIIYGTEQNGILSLGNKSKLYGQIYRRLIPCIWDQMDVPFDMVNLAVSRASSPVSYEKRYNWERTLSLACSLVKKMKKQQNPKEVWTLALNRKSRDRNYLYGRLLAVADRVEYRTFDKKDRDANRETNARRYMSMFSQRPYETWKIIEESLEPYFPKLKYQEKIYYCKQLEEICELFDEETFKDNSKLDGLYLLGFHSESYELRNKEADKAQDITSEEE